MQQTLIDNRYKLVELLGSGGMAEVYLARDGVLDRNVALKVLRQQYASDEEFVERFRQEAKSAAKLSHPSIVSVYDQGRSEDDGAYYIAMEYVPGGTLKDRIQREGALAPGEAAGVALQIAEALQVAHERGVIHRDIKPQNVLLTERGAAKVTDFGIARAASAATRVTRTGVVLGTAGYMSPEQAKGEPVGPASDLYSLGVVLHEMLTGNLPYEAESPLAQAIKHISEPPPSPREVNPEVPEALDAITMKLLAKNPEERYPSAAALAEDLERARSGFPPVAAFSAKTGPATAPLPSSPERRTRRTAVRPPVAAPVRAPERDGRRLGRLFPVLAALLLILAVLGGLTWALQNFDTPESEGSGDESGAVQVEISGVEVPNVVGLARDVALDLLYASGFRVEVQPRESSWEQAGVVLDQSVAGGERAEAGSLIVIGVGNGPSNAQVPAQNPDTPASADGGVSDGIPPSPQAAPEAPVQPQPAQPVQLPDEDGEFEDEGEDKEGDD
jgi:tRNA A-37 threonylcarbamoyl transferase component Bud32